MNDFPPHPKAKMTINDGPQMSSAAQSQWHFDTPPESMVFKELK